MQLVEDSENTKRLYYFKMTILFYRDKLEFILKIYYTWVLFTVVNRYFLFRNSYKANRTTIMVIFEMHKTSVTKQNKRCIVEPW